MKWSIMIVTQPSRAELLARLLNILEPQVAECSDSVEIKVLHTDRSLLHGEYCQRLREEISGEYSNFVDDDDLVPDTYVKDILPFLDGVDFIGYKISRYDDENLTGTYEHSLQHGGSSSPHSTPHINPIRTEVALKARMVGGFGADRRWWNNLIARQLIQTEHFIDKVLYEYYYRSNKSDGCP